MVWLINKNKRILHIAYCDKFLPPFVDFLNENFDPNKHYFLLKDGMAEKDLKKYKNTKLLKRSTVSRLNRLVITTIEMHKAERIILHGLFDREIILILFLFPWFLKKSDWVVWGGDLYEYKRAKKSFKSKMYEYLRRFIIKRFDGLITYLKGDYELAKRWYGANGIYKECFMYESNLYKELSMNKTDKKTINILVGNSSNPSNNHFDIFDRLDRLKNEDIKLFSPLSYGNKKYAEDVIKEGNAKFPGKFKPLTDFFSFDDYLELLSEIDIAIFNHDRQQAMGNTIMLLGLGKTVYMRSDVTPWLFFKDRGIWVGDIEEFELKLDNGERLKDNISKVKSIFSKEELISQWDMIFSSAEKNKP